MEAYARPLRHLMEWTEHFVRSPRLRVLSVGVDLALRDGALAVVMGLEHHAENRSPFVRLDEPHRRDDGGWWRRLEALRAAHEERRAGMAEHGYALPPLPPPPGREQHALSAFAVQLHQLLVASCAPLRGLVVVLAPAGVEDPAHLEHELLWLVNMPALGEVRFVVVDLGAPSIGGGGLGDAHARVECRVDELEARRELRASIEAAESAVPGAPGPARTGAAWPRGVAPPSRRPRTPLGAEQRAALAASLGVPGGLLDPGLAALRPMLLRGALSLREGDAMAAVEQQRRAVAHAQGLGLERESLVMELVLVTYMLQAGHAREAEELCLSIARRAEAGGFHDVAAQARMTAGSLRLVARDPEQAAVYYGQAGQGARDAGELPLAIEGYRMAGELRLDAGDQPQARRLLLEALDLGKQLPPGQARQTTAPLAGRQLAAVFRSLGLAHDAARLEAEAARLEVS